MAGLGIGLVGVGVMLAASRPSCGYDGVGAYGGGFGTSYSYEAAYVNGACDVAVHVRKSQPLFISPDLYSRPISYFESTGDSIEYVSNIRNGQGFLLFLWKWRTLFPRRATRGAMLVWRWRVLARS